MEKKICSALFKTWMRNQWTYAFALEIQIPNPSTLDKKLKKHKRASDHIRRIRSNCDSYLDFLNLFKYENVLQTVHASQPNYINEWLPGEMCLPHP